MSGLTKVMIDFFHIAPLALITLIHLASTLRSKISGSESIIPAISESHKSISTLFLCAFGIAFGSTAHSCSSVILDPCLFYAGIVFVISIKMALKNKSA